MERGLQNQRNPRNKYLRNTENDEVHQSHEGMKKENLKKEIAKHQNNISQLLIVKKNIENELLQIPDIQRTPREKKSAVELENKLNIINNEINESKKKIRELNKLNI